MPVQMLAPEMDQIVLMDLDIERLVEGFGGTNGPAEGPVGGGGRLPSFQRHSQ